MDAGANASVLPARERRESGRVRRRCCLAAGFRARCATVCSAIEGGPLVSLAIATNILAALTGSASGGLTIALDTLGRTFMDVAAQPSIDPALMHRVAVIGSGMLDILPHNGAVVSLLAICGLTHRDSYFDIVMVGNRRLHCGADGRHRDRRPLRIFLSRRLLLSASVRPQLLEFPLRLP